MNPRQETQVGRAGMIPLPGQGRVPESRDLWSSCTWISKVGSGSILPSASPPGGQGLSGMLRCLLAGIPEGLTPAQMCLQGLLVARQTAAAARATLGVFRLGSFLNSQRFPETIPLMGWKRISCDYCRFCCHLSPTTPCHHQTWSQGDPRAVSHMDPAGSLQPLAGTHCSLLLPHLPAVAGSSWLHPSRC